VSLKHIIGILLGIGIGAGCRFSGVSLPAPPAITGALLVVTITLGYLLACRLWPSDSKEKGDSHVG
jgi:XapX domain-containing protein